MRRLVLLLGLVVLCGCGIQDRTSKLESMRHAFRKENKQLKKQTLRLELELAELKEKIERRETAERQAEEAANQIDILFFGKESDRPLTPEEQEVQDSWKEFLEWRKENVPE